MEALTGASASREKSRLVEARPGILERLRLAGGEGHELSAPTSR
jgi:hypothetical protein